MKVTIEQTDELAHYGVLGMKWGVRKDPAHAYSRAQTKAHRMDKKQVQLDTKTNAAIAKVHQLQSKAYKNYVVQGFGPSGGGVTVVNNRLAKKLSKATLKAGKKAAKSLAMNNARAAWQAAIEDAFKDVPLERFSKEEREAIDIAIFGHKS